MKKLTLIFALGLGLSTAAFAGSPKTNDLKSDGKTTEASATDSKTTESTAYFQYNGPQSGDPEDLDDPDNYGTTQVNPSTLCGTPGTKRCAAEFNIDGSGHRVGDPTSNIVTKQ